MKTPDLIRKAQAGDRRANQLLWGECMARLRRIAGPLLYNDRDVDDAVQDALLHAWRSFAKFRPDGNFNGWTGAITANAARDLRSRRIRDYVGYAELEQHHASMPSNELVVHERLETHQEMARALELLDQIPAIFREVFILHALGFEHREIAERLHIRIGTSCSRLHRAHALLARAARPDEHLFFMITRRS
jgi:RNA polymerase sigma-70 factor (ECF subfamily)